MRQPNQLSNESLYKEACDSYRHYSILIKDVRLLTIVQGITVLSGIGFLIQSNLYSASIITAIFGLFLTMTLHRLHKTYFTNAMNLLNYIYSELEGGIGPWSNQHDFHLNRTEKQMSKILIRHGIFVLIYSMCGLILIAAIFKFQL